MYTKPTNPRRTLFGKNKYEYVPYSVYCKKGRKEANQRREEFTGKLEKKRREYSYIGQKGRRKEMRGMLRKRVREA